MIVALIVGLSVGSIYGLTAMGLVLTYRTTGVFNLGHGAVGMVGTYAFWELWQRSHWPLGLAALVVLGIVAPAMGALLHYAIFRWVLGKPIVVGLFASVAVLISLQGLVAGVWGTVFHTMPSLFPFRVIRVTSSFNATLEQVGTAAVALLVGGLLFWFLRSTQLGLRMRAVVDKERLAATSGNNTERVQLLSWVIGSVVATVSAMLITPFIQLSVVGLTLVVIQAMAAAVVGRFRSLPLTYAGGLGIGVLEALLARYLPSGQVAQGLKISAAFLVLYAVVVLGNTVFRAFGQVSTEGIRTGLLGREMSPSSLAPILVTFAALGLAYPFVGPFYQFALASALATSIAIQGLVLVTGYCGQVHLAQAALMGVGGLMYARMVTEGWVPEPVAVLLALAMAVVFGLFVAVPALRIRGLPLALLTLAFGVFMDNFVFGLQAFSGGFSGYNLDRPVIAGLDTADDSGLYYLILGLALGAAVLVRNLLTGRSGRVIVATKNSDVAAEAFGSSVWRTKMILFALSSLFAGLAGVLIAVQSQAIAPQQFNISQSILLLVIAVLGGLSGPLGAVLGGLTLFVLPDLLDRIGMAEFQQAFFGVGAAVILMSGQGGLGDMVGRTLAMLLPGPSAPGRRSWG